MVVIGKGDFIWIEALPSAGSTILYANEDTTNRRTNGVRVPIGARVIYAEGDRITVLDDDANERKIGPEQRIRVMHPTSIQGVEDLTHLVDLHEAAILRNLLIRYKEKLIYTYSGTILVAVNPLQNLPNYGQAQAHLYRNKRRSELPPHIFALANKAYRNGVLNGTNSPHQCLIIGGESGAGKTFTSKLAVEFLAYISKNASRGDSCLAQQLINAIPILEAFGNAKTLRNNNSSRFGQFIDLQFNTSNSTESLFNNNSDFEGNLQSARFTTLLLEKWRVVGPLNGERNFHIFYSILQGLAPHDKFEFELANAADYHILTAHNRHSSNSSIPQFSKELSETTPKLSDLWDAMKMLLFKDAEIRSIIKILAALLHIGNLKYHISLIDNTEQVEIRDNLNISRIAKLLQIPANNLVEAFKSRRVILRDESVKVSMDAEQALNARDELMQNLYAHIFDYVVMRTNEALYRTQKRDSAKSRKSIGILDLFGVETCQFANAGFEQLCKNFAQERLHQYFVDRIFKYEQAEYEAQRIHWTPVIDFPENFDVLAMLIGGTESPQGILSLIDEESLNPQGNDESLLRKLQTTHSTNTNFLKPKSNLSKFFGVQHFCGTVNYQIKGFCEKNREKNEGWINGLINSSQSRFLQRIFDKSNDGTELNANPLDVVPTMASRFRNTLEALMAEMGKREPSFVYCIRPNDWKKPMFFDRDTVQRQLHYFGLLEITRIQNSGFSHRYDYITFVQRYRIFLPNSPAASKIEDYVQLARHICTIAFGAEVELCQFGKTKLFLKNHQNNFLEQEHERILIHYVKILQKSTRAFIQKLRFQRLRKAVIVVQKNWRAYVQRIKYKKILQGIVRLQATLRSYQLVAHFNSLKNTITLLQAHCRGHLLRNELRAACSRQERHAIMRARAEACADYSTEPLPNYSKPDYEIDDFFDYSSHDREFGMPEYENGGEEKFHNNNIDISAYEIGKFAAAYFTDQVNAQYMRKALRYALLSHESNAEQIASLGIWISILRFMGDLPEQSEENFEPNPPNGDNAQKSFTHGHLGESSFARMVIRPQNQTKEASIMNRLHSSLSRKVSPNDLQIASQTARELFTNIHYNNTINASLKSSAGIEKNANILFESLPKTNEVMEKIQYIIGFGILRATLRDEIYCQICKQLNNNPSNISKARGWILLALCAGCFGPSKKFRYYLKAFVEGYAPADYANYIKGRLERLHQNGIRKQPPCFVEFQAAKGKKPLLLNIALMDGESVTVKADACSTAYEICSTLSSRIGLVGDTFGFSLYVAVADKVASMGDGQDKVLDAISQCEQLRPTTTTTTNNKTPWRLFFRKEIFAPWHDPSEDSISTNLIYHQIIRGIRFGEYRCERDEDLSLLCAQQYYIDNPKNSAYVDVENLEKALGNYLPESELGNKDSSENGFGIEKWLQLVLHVYRKKFLSDKKSPTDRENVKNEIVKFAMQKWPLLFSRFFEAYKFNGPPLSCNEVVLAINRNGLHILSSVDDRPLVFFTFCQIANVNVNITKRSGADSLHLRTLSASGSVEEWTFQAPNAIDICTLLQKFIGGLQKRSKYLLVIGASAQMDIPEGNSEQEDDKFLECQIGDLLILASNSTGSDCFMGSKVRVENTRSGMHGIIATRNVYVLPTLVKPDVELMELLNRQNEQSQMDGVLARNAPHSPRFFAFNNNTQQIVPFSSNSISGIYQAAHTLEQFAKDNFRGVGTTPTSRSGANSRNGPMATQLTIENGEIAINGGSHERGELWRHSRDALREPLLRKLEGKPEPSEEALLSFACIQRYMGDLPLMAAPPPAYFLESTDLIFRAPLKYPILRDEIYCQLMKQLTDNPHPLSEERGWELLWLCLGLFPPSNGLYTELNQFLRSRFLPIAADCAIRLQKAVNCGDYRKFPPHQVEVEAIQHKTTQIFHKIYFPDSSEDVVEVDSLTKAKDLSLKIASKLRLKSHIGFNAFVKMGEKVISIPEQEYLFDFLHQLADWALLQTKPANKSSAVFSYQIYYMRKLWINVQPGKDIAADLIFHYYQELPKYLRGYHHVNKVEAAQLGALILRAQTRDDKPPPWGQFQHIIQDILPKDLIKTNSASEWKKCISEEYLKLDLKNSSEAKIAFLKYLSVFPTFGSAFFEVKQSSDPTLASRVIVSINPNGIALYNQDTKEHIVSYPFNIINNWTSGNTYFHLTLGSVIKGNRLLFETTLAYKMDDLLTSYIQVLLSDKNRPKNNNRTFNNTINNDDYARLI